MFQPRRMRGPISARDPSDSAATAFAAFVAESSSRVAGLLRREHQVSFGLIGVFV